MKPFTTKGDGQMHDEMVSDQVDKLKGNALGDKIRDLMRFKEEPSIAMDPLRSTEVFTDLM